MGVAPPSRSLEGQIHRQLDPPKSHSNLLQASADFRGEFTPLNSP